MKRSRTSAGREGVENGAVSDEARRAVVSALTGLAASPDYRDRADAGRALACFADIPGAREALRGLLLDADDTFVTRVTAEALFRRHDRAGLAVAAAAFATADPNHADYIHTAMIDVFVVYAAERDAAVRECEALSRDANAAVRDGAIRFIDALAGIDPVLHPA